MGVRTLATKLAAAGHTVEVHSTTAEDMATWADESPAGTTSQDGVTVHRHRTTARRHRRFESLSRKVLADPAGVGNDLESRWIKAQGPHSPDLLDAVAAIDTDVVVMSPYLYEPTLLGVHRSRVPTVIHPASHDEPPLRLPSVSRALTAADGLGFYTDAERRLTERVIPDTRLMSQMLVGLGIDQPAEPHQNSRVAMNATLSTFGLDDVPYFLVLGRVDRGKGTHALVEMFGDLHRRSAKSTRLVVAGPIIDHPPPTPGVDVIGPVSESDKQGLLRGAIALINPSVMESFSLVVLESWMAGTAVIVNAGCPATVEHARRSGGGLAYSDASELALAVNLLATRPDLADGLASKGRKYVEDWYTWPAILKRYIPFLNQVIDHARPAHRRATAA